MDWKAVRKALMIDSAMLRFVANLVLFFGVWALGAFLICFGVAGIVVSFTTGNFWHLLVTPVAWYLALLLTKALTWLAMNLVFRS
jgi:hypothetical protein